MHSPSRGNLFMLGLIVGGTLASIGVFYALSAAQIFLGIIIPLTVLQFSAQVTGIFLPCVIYALITKQRLADFFAMRRISGANITLVLLMTFMLLPAAMWLGAFSSLFTEPGLLGFFAQMYDQPFWVIVAVMCAAPAVFEEMALRGVVMREYRHVSLRKMALMNGLLFALMHLSLEQFLYAFLLGAVFACFVYYTESVWSAVLSHFTFNFINTAAAYSAFHSAVAGGETVEDFIQRPDRREQVFNLMAALPVTAFCAAVFCVLFMSFVAYNKRRRLRAALAGTLMHSIFEKPPTVEMPQKDVRVLTWAFWVLAACYVAVVVFI